MNNDRIVDIVQYGMGGVGRALLSQIVEHAAHIRTTLGIELRYRALIDSQNVLHLNDNEALSFQHMSHLANSLRANSQERLINQQRAIKKPSDLAVLATELERIKSTTGGARLVVVDVSGTDDLEMPTLLTAALRQGQRVVLANKRPLCAPMDVYANMIKQAGVGSGRLRYEATVGAALPVISTLQSLLAAQDEISQISGCFSGTLGYLTSRLEDGISYSQAVSEAKAKGYTEPDPRDDLGGVDVARKALILARTLGNTKLELSDIEIEPLYPASMAELSIAEFMERTSELDQEYQARIENAKAAGQVLRYVGTVNNDKCQVGLKQVDKNTALGQLRGTANIITFQTKRYDNQPLVIQGPGAGTELTASAVLADIISLFRHQ